MASPSTEVKLVIYSTFLLVRAAGDGAIASPMARYSSGYS